MLKTFRVLAALAALIASACSASYAPHVSSALPASADSGRLPPVTNASQLHEFCPRTSDPRRMRCNSVLRADVLGAFPCNGTAPYCPQDLRSAYKWPSNKGGTMTVAVIDAYGYRQLPADLATYRSTFKLKACPLGSCFKVLNQNGKTSPLPPESGFSDDWHGEQALDVDMVSAICPNCKIVIVQANDDFLNNLEAAVVTAAKVVHADIISMSFGGSEFASGDSNFGMPGITYVASSGDFGAGIQQPCAFVTVICVGGTALKPAANARGWNETVWNTLEETGCGSGNCGATGSGCSAKVPAPSWQQGQSCGKFRVEADLSADASVDTPVAVYSAPEGGWVAIGGTSASAPMVAAAIALAGNAHTIDGPQYIWAHRKSLNDVTKGNNVDSAMGVLCPGNWPHYVCYARGGYDGPTGWGTPNGLGAL